MTYLPELKEQLMAAPLPAAPARRRARRPLVVAAGVLVATGLATAALAATGVIGVGSPIGAGNALLFRDPHRGTGAIVPGSVRLLALRVADPDGGPPWGMRVLGTTRGVGCVQIGRVVNGTLGVLGRDGVAHNDRRFHALSPKAVDPTDCATLDADGHLFLSVTGPGFLASGPAPRRQCLGPGAHAGPRDHIQTRCPNRDWRRITYGLLGPHATSVKYQVGHQTRVQPVARPDGAYLIVARSHTDIGGAVNGLAATIGSSAKGAREHQLQRIDYEDAPSCPAPKPDSAPAIVTCPLVGYVRTHQQPPTSAQVARRLHVQRRFIPARSVLQVRVSFDAPIAVSGAASYYALETPLPRTRSCGGIYMVPRQTNTDIAAGQRVVLTARLPSRCPGPIHATVRLVTPATQRAPAPSMPPLPFRRLNGPLVGNFNFTK